VNLSLIWQGDLKFSAGPGGPPIELDSAAPGVVSPMQTLGYAVMACMAMDVVHMLQKGRHDLQELSVVLDAERAPQPPRRLTAISLRFDIRGGVPGDAVERAIELSRTKYCSAWNSLRQDIQLSATYAIRA
jgi:putative redox protein